MFKGRRSGSNPRWDNPYYGRCQAGINVRRQIDDVPVPNRSAGLGMDRFYTRWVKLGIEAIVARSAEAVVPNYVVRRILNVGMIVFRAAVCSLRRCHMCGYVQVTFPNQFLQSLINP